MRPIGRADARRAAQFIECSSSKLLALANKLSRTLNWLWAGYFCFDDSVHDLCGDLLHLANKERTYSLKTRGHAGLFLPTLWFWCCFVSTLVDVYQLDEIGSGNISKPANLLAQRNSSALPDCLTAK
jgi:hypothetical protein